MAGRRSGLPRVISTVHGFPPLCGPDVSSLILGPMPGAASLQAGEYYAHPRNAFWSITESLFGIARVTAYPARVLALTSAGIAVWDVLRVCSRSGSLDSAIARDSIVTNDFSMLLRRYPGIRRMFFNGGTARQLYERHVLTELAKDQRMIPRFTLPSTSPANARLSLQQKTQAWRVISQSD
jgi:double-stranded uracil-DNA glycosylase